MWIVLIIVAIIVFIIIRAYVVTSGTFKVVNKSGITMNIGSYAECLSYAKAQNDYCKTFGIDDYFKIKRYKI